MDYMTMTMMTLLLLPDITFHYRWSQPGSASSGPAPVPLTSQGLPAAPSGDPSQLLGKLCAALHAGPDAYYKAAAAWRAKFPLAALPDPRKDFLGCEGGSGRAERMRDPPTFPGHLPSTWQGGFAQTYHMTRVIECWR